jgi:hypothetical protein
MKKDGDIKNIMRLTCLALFCVGAGWIGHEITLQFGSAVIFLFAAFVLAAPSGVLFSALEGYVRSDGFHARAPGGRSGLVNRLRLLQTEGAARTDVTLIGTCSYKSET